MDQAIEMARSLNRPFTEGEVLAHARREGYCLRLTFDPRFKKISGRKGLDQPPLWIVKEADKTDLTAKLNDLKGQRVDCHVRVKQIEHEIDESFHWYTEYKPMRVQEIRQIASGKGIDPQQSKNALIEALIASRIQALENQIKQVQQETLRLTNEIKHLEEQIAQI